MNSRTFRRRAAALASALLLVSAPAFAIGNPMEEVGRMHNVYLDCLVSRGVTNDASMLRRVVDECGYRPADGDTQAFVERYASMLPIDLSVSVTDRMRPYRERFSDYEFSFFERIDDILSTAETREDAANRLIALENEAVAKLDPGSTGGSAVLSGLSVALYSLEYWSAYYATQAATERKTDVVAARPKWWVRVLVTVGADLAGGAVGGPGLGAVTSGGALAAMRD